MQDFLLLDVKYSGYTTNKKNAKSYVEHEEIRHLVTSVDITLISTFNFHKAQKLSIIFSISFCFLVEEIERKSYSEAQMTYVEKAKQQIQQEK